MNWFLNILGIEAPEGTTLQFPPMPDLRGLSLVSAIVVVLVALVFFAGTFFLYFRERGRLGPVRRIMLAFLRVAVLVFLLILLLRPVLLAVFEGERPRNIAFLLDDTKSMQQIDKRQDPADKIRVAIAKGLLPPESTIYETAVLARLDTDKLKDVPRVGVVKAVLGNEKIDLIGKLEERGPVRAFLFGETLRSELEKRSKEKVKKSLSDQLQERLTALQGKTALGDALFKLVSQPGADVPAAIVVVTDGRNNAGATLLLEAAQECRNAKVPLHIYGVGSSTGGTLQLIDVAAQETIFYDDIVTVPIRWKARGFKKGTLQIKVMLGDQKVADKEIKIENGQDLRDVLTFKPKKTDNFPKGELQLKVSLKLKENDQFRDEMKRPVRLSDSKVKVLYVENGPRWEFKFLQPLLSRDRRVDARYLLVNGDPRLMKHRPFLATFPKREDLLKYDLIILGDVSAGWLGKERIEALRDFVRDFRGGLIVLAGRQYNPSSYSDTVLAEVLPVEFLPAKFKIEDVAKKRPVAFQSKLTRAGEMAPMLALSDEPKENLQIWRGLPGFYWHYPVTKLRPGATALLVHPYDKAGKEPMPILAQQYYGRGQVLFLTTDEVWRWRYNTEDKYYSRFWGQVIYKLALPHLLGDASRRVQMALERSEAILNREGYIYVRLLDEEYRPFKDKEVKATLEFLDAGPGAKRRENVTFQAVPGRTGEYRLFRKHSRPGRFDLKFRLPSQNIDQSFQYRVKLPPRHELEEAGLAEDALREAARLSGGGFYREEDLYRLSSEVQERKTKYTVRQEILLWNPLVFFLFLGLITTEWLVRKFANLS